jgi:hypothetical protein
LLDRAIGVDECAADGASPELDRSHGGGARDEPQRASRLADPAVDGIELDEQTVVEQALHDRPDGGSRHAGQAGEVGA